MTDDTGSINRRDFLVKLLRLGGLSATSIGLGFWLNGRSRRPEAAFAETVTRSFGVSLDSNLPEMVVVMGNSPGLLVQKAIEELGGITRFIARDDVVVIKPNIGWDRTPEQAANTNPDIVAEVARLCWEAGAKKVIVTDVSCNDPRRSFQRSGIAKAASAVDAQVILPDKKKFTEVNIQGEVLGIWPVFEPFLVADKVINIPVAKHHSLTRVTLGMKNWYGILGGQRSRLHQRIHESIVELAEFMQPTLTIIDAYRILLRNGPTGGNLRDVALKKTIVAGTDPVALDAYVAKAYWDLDYRKLNFIKLANDRGLGNMNFEDLYTKVINL